MRPALSLIAATVLVLLAGCSAHRAVEQKTEGDPDWWLDTMHDVYEHYVDAIEKSCPPQGLLSNEKCVKARIIETFGKQNNAGTHCRTDEPSGSVLLCADLLTATERIYVALGLDPQQFIDWDDPYDSMTSLEQLLAARLTSKCPDTAQKDCVTQEVADLLAISANEAGRCIVTSDVKKQLRCATGIIRIEGYKTALRDVA